MVYPQMPHGMHPHAQFGPGMMYSPYMNPYVSMPVTPFEQTNAELYRYQEGSEGKLIGAGVGVAGGAVGGGVLAGLLTGAKAGAAAGAVTRNPIAIAIGIVGGAAVCGVLGALGFQKLWEFDAIDKDAKDDFKLNGSPRYIGNQQINQNLGYHGVF